MLLSTQFLSTQIVWTVQRWPTPQQLVCGSSLWFEWWSRKLELRFQYFVSKKYWKIIHFSQPSEVPWRLANHSELRDSHSCHQWWSSLVRRAVIFVDKSKVVPVFRVVKSKGHVIHLFRCKERLLGTVVGIDFFKFHTVRCGRHRVCMLLSQVEIFPIILMILSRSECSKYLIYTVTSIEPTEMNTNIDSNPSYLFQKSLDQLSKMCSFLGCSAYEVSCKRTVGCFDGLCL